MSESSAASLPEFVFNGVALHRRGWQAPVSISVAPPICARPNEYVCAVSCVLEEELARPVRSSTPEHAYALTFRFLRFMLAEFSLFDRGGNPFHLPRVVPEEDDFVIPERTPESGIRVHARAVGPDGEIRPFAVGVSAPHPVEDQYAAEVRYGAKDPAAVLVRAPTSADAFYAGLDWIENRLTADRLTLLGLWNMPIELPKRPTS